MVDSAEKARMCSLLRLGYPFSHVHQCPVCKADVTQPSHLATRTVLTEESLTPVAPSHSRPTSPETATERTPLLTTDTNTNDTH